MEPSPARGLRGQPSPAHRRCHARVSHVGAAEPGPHASWLLILLLSCNGRSLGGTGHCARSHTRSRTQSPSALPSHAAGAFLGVWSHVEWRLRSPHGNTRLAQDLRVLPSTAAQSHDLGDGKQSRGLRGGRTCPRQAGLLGATHVCDPGPRTRVRHTGPSCRAPESCVTEKRSAWLPGRRVRTAGPGGRGWAHATAVGARGPGAQDAGVPHTERTA